MTGPGKYDHLCTHAREQAGAEGCILLIFGGIKGSGFSAQLPDFAAPEIPKLLRDLALLIERDTKGMKAPHQ